MPKHSLVLPYDKFRGGIKLPGRTTGLVLYDTPRAGLVSRQLVVPTNPKSTAQTEARGFLSAAAVAYKSLTVSEADAWIALAAQMTYTNVLGINYELTGIAVYIMVNTYRQYAGVALTDVAPDFDDIPPPYTAVTSFGLAATDLEVVIDATGVADGAFGFIRCTNSIDRESRKLRVNELRIPFATSSECFIASSSGVLTWTGNAPDLLTMANTEFCGFEVTLMSAAYLPRSSQFVAQQLLTDAS